MLTLNCAQADSEVTVSQIDFPFKSEPPALDDSSHHSVYPVGGEVAVESPDDSLEIGEILGEIFGGSPASSDVSFAMPAPASVPTPNVDPEQYQLEGSNDVKDKECWDEVYRETTTDGLPTEVKFETDASLHSCTY